MELICVCLIMIINITILLIIYNSCKYENMDNSMTYFERDSRTAYDNKAFDVEYHTPASEIEGTTESGSWLQHNGKITFYPWSKMTNTYTYNKKDYYKYGNASYVPSYEDSVYLSYSRK